MLGGVLPALLALVHAPLINGPYYWKWGYIDDNPAPFFALALLAWAVLYWVDGRARQSPAPSLGSLVALAWVLTFSFTALTPDGLARVEERVKHPDITSYYTEALKIDDLGDWLDDYDQRLYGMVGHAGTHPPGPILWYRFWNQLVGPDNGARYGGLFLGIVSGLVILPLFSVARRATGDQATAIAACSLWSVMPAATIMLGSLDAAYPILTAILATLWMRAAWDGRTGFAAGFGVALFAGLMFTHSFWLTGVLFVLMGLTPIAFGEDRSAQLQRFVRSGLVGLVTGIGLFAAMGLVAGYDHLAALSSSLDVQDGFAAMLNRPWGYTVFWDAYDFFLASGWITFGLLLAFAWRWRSQGHPGQTPWAPAFAASALATLAIVDLSGLLRAETARVWLFLQPLIFPLLGYELSRWTTGWRLAAYGVLVFSLAVIRSRLSFI